MNFCLTIVSFLPANKHTITYFVKNQQRTKKPYLDPMFCCIDCLMNLLLFQQYSEKDVYTQSFHYLNSHFFLGLILSPITLLKLLMLVTPMAYMLPYARINSLHSSTAFEIVAHSCLPEILSLLDCLDTISFQLPFYFSDHYFFSTLLDPSHLLASKFQSDHNSTLRLHLFILYAYSLGDFIHSWL